MWDDEWNPNTVQSNYEVLGIVDPEDLEQLVKDAKQLKLVLDIVKNDYPEVYADLILKNIL